MPQAQDDINGADAMKQAPTPGLLSDAERYEQAKRDFNRMRDDGSLAPTAPVEASGSELADAVARTKEDRERAHPNHKTMFVNIADLDLILSALRPQPSGETRDAVARIIRDQSRGRCECVAYHKVYAVSERGARDIADALLSARPLALGGQHSGGEGRGVELTFGMGALVVNTGTFGGDNAVFIAKATAPGEVGAYTGNAAFKRDVLQPGEHVLIFPTAEQAKAVADALCTPARAEALDEGAAAWQVMKEGQPVPGVWPYPDREGAENFLHGHGDGLRPLYAHPSPTPAAQDDDRVRIAVKALEEAKNLVTGREWKQQAYAVRYRIDKALAALKSEGK